MFLKLSFPAYAFGLFALVFCVNAPAPLFYLFRQQMNLEPQDLALLYSVYSAAIILALPISGRLSDRFGRQVSVILGLVLAAIGCVMIAESDSLAGLLAGRFTQALAVAAMSAPAAAALTELSLSGSASSALAATLAMAFGGSLGPLSAGLIAETVSAQRVAPMATAAALAALAALLILLVPAPRRVKVADQVGCATTASRYDTAFFSACAAVIIAFGVQSTFFTMSGPRFGEMLGAHILVSAGASMGVFMLASGAGMIMGRSISPATSMSVGVVLLSLGISLFFLLLDGASFPFIAASVLIAGSGHGLAYVGALRRINELAPPATRARYTSMFYIAIYTGGGLPVLLMGLLARVTGLSMACNIFSAVIAVASVLLLFFLRSGSLTIVVQPTVNAAKVICSRKEGGAD